MFGKKQSQFLKSRNGGLSFLRKQESGVLEGPGFRIECGMTGQKDDGYKSILQNKANLLRFFSFFLDSFALDIARSRG
jgi:hypothetical protein